MSSDATRLQTISPSLRKKLATRTGKTYGSAEDVYGDPDAVKLLQGGDLDDSDTGLDDDDAFDGTFGGDAHEQYFSRLQGLKSQRMPTSELKYKPTRRPPMSKDEREANFKSLFKHGANASRFSSINFKPKERKYKSPTDMRVGMDDLFNIVINLQRDVRKISKAQSEAGAREVAASLSKRYGTDFDVAVEDLNGDDIPDVVIHDEDHTPYVVNGYTLAKTKYPMNNFYYSTRGEGQKRKAWKEDMFGKADYGDDILNSYVADPFDKTLSKPKKLTGASKEQWRKVKKAMELKHKPKPTRLSPYTLFQQLLKVITDTLHLQIPDRTKVVASLWNELIVNGLMGYYGVDTDDVEHVKKFKSTKVFKQAIQNLMLSVWDRQNRKPFTLLLAECLMVTCGVSDYVSQTAVEQLKAKLGVAEGDRMTIDVLDNMLKGAIQAVAADESEDFGTYEHKHYDASPLKFYS